MERHVVVGSGPVGSAIARRLTSLRADEREVVLASRSGAGPAIQQTTRVAVDASDSAALSDVTAGAAVIYNALNPTAYHAWAVQWPPMWSALVAAAERSGALLATVGNLYAYGVPDGAMDERSPVRPVEDKGAIRAEQWAEAEQAHRDGRFAALEVRGSSDYIGAGTESALTRALTAAVAGRTARVLGSADLPHSWTHPDDVAAVIVAAAADPAAHGRVWHVPTNAPRTQREVITEVAAAAGVPAPRISPTPDLLLRTVGLFDRDAGAAAKVGYQFRHPFVIDDGAARAAFDLTPRGWSDVVAEVAASLSGHGERAGAGR